MFNDDYATFIDPNRMTDPTVAVPAEETEIPPTEEEPPLIDAA